MHPKIADAIRLGKKAREILDNSKWVNRAPRALKGEHCSVTPICMAQNTFSSRELFFCIFLEEANKITQTAYYYITEWNDRPERTREQVNLAYDNTIKRLENAEVVEEKP